MRSRIDVARRSGPGFVQAAIALALFAPPNIVAAAPEEEEDPDFPTKKEKAAEDEDESDAEFDARVEDEAESKEETESRLSGKQAIAVERKKRWIKRWAPQRDMLDIGMSIGVLFNPSSHGMFDAGEGPRPPLDRAAFDFDFRVSYMPLSFLGVGIETGVMPTVGGNPEARADQFTFRALALAQIPYRITPTFAIGGGLLGIRSSESAILNEIDGAFVWGLGLKMYVNQWIAVRIDGRHLVTASDGEGTRGNYGELLFGVDVTLRMRRLIKSRKRDSDNDGVDDKYDTCPKERGDGDDGCPTKKDSDGDGWIDREDKCPKVYGDGARGCPVPDQDNDGIYDSKDECETEPETRNGFKDTDGCPDEAPEEVKRLTGTIEGITFDSGQATIRKSSRGALLAVVKTLKEYPDIRIEIVGHTDDQGGRDSNVQLSKDRATAVAGYLVSQGIAAERVTARGMGPDEPVADNKTKAGRAKNRRIEFKVLP
jgi:outer membrane protein OmpA-like peptidoglycan-associated protein